MSQYLNTAQQLVGAGLQAAGVAIPIGPVSEKLIDGMRSYGLPVPPKTWFKCVNKDAIGASGASPRFASPRPSSSSCCCKSAERPKAQNQPAKERIAYYTPQKLSSGANLLVASPDPKSQKLTEAKAKSPKSQQHLNPENKHRDSRRRLDSNAYGREEPSCMYCSSSSRQLLQLPCGALVCCKCDEIEEHEEQCKMCKKLGSN